MSDQVKFVLDESRLPEAWYNIAADLPAPPPPVLHPGTGQPVGPDDLAPLFPMQIILQEVSTDRLIAIPEEVRSVYRQWRPTPLYRARRLERALETPARIYYKYEGVSPTGSHKPNTAVAQAYYNKAEGVTRLTTETGAGQWGSALAFAGAVFGLEVDVYMVRVSYDQKPYRRALIETFGARVVASPSEETNAGRTILAEHPDSTGSLGIAISEAVEAAAPREDTKYSLGSVLNHVLMHQTVIGEEAQMQMDEAEDYPDVVIGCTGGGSNFSGLSFPVHRARAARGVEDPRHRGRAGRVSEPHEGYVRVRLRRHRPSHAAREDAHARLGLRPAAVPRRRAPLPRDGAPGQPPARARPDRGARVLADRGVRRRRRVRAARGHRPGARGQSRGEGDHGRGDPLSRGGRLGGDPVQPLRSRPLRHAGVHRLHGGEAHRRRRTRRRRSRWRSPVCRPSRPRRDYTSTMPNTPASRNTFSEMITVATKTAARVVTRRLTSEPMSSRRLQTRTSGMSANGMPNDSTT